MIPMGFTTILLIVFSVLLILDGIAFIYGMKTKSWTACILITAIMIAGIAVLGYLWLTSPM